MLEFLIALALVIGTPVIAVAIWALLRNETSNIERTKFPHWIKSLMRVYSPGARIVISHRQSPATIEILHASNQDASSNLLIQVPHLGTEAPRASEFSDAVLLHESVSLEDDPEFLLTVRAQVADIWPLAAASIPARVVNRILDVLGIGSSERFDLKFSGERSLEGTREVRRRQKAGLLEEW